MSRLLIVGLPSLLLSMFAQQIWGWHGWLIATYGFCSGLLVMGLAWLVDSPDWIKEWNKPRVVRTVEGLPPGTVPTKDDQ